MKDYKQEIIDAQNEALDDIYNGLINEPFESILDKIQSHECKLKEKAICECLSLKKILNDRSPEGVYIL